MPLVSSLMEHLKREVSASLHPPEGHYTCPISVLFWAQTQDMERNRDGRRLWGTRLPLLGTGPPLAGCPSRTPPAGISAVGTEQWASQRKGCRSCELPLSVWSLSILSPAKQKSKWLARGSSIVSVKRTRWALLPHACIALGRVCVRLLYDSSQVKPSCCRGEMAVQHPCCH